MVNEVFFDLETKKLFSDINDNDPGKLGVSIVGIYEREIDKNLKEISGKLSSYWEKDFKKMWPIFQDADRIIGFNNIHFDVPALSSYAPFPFGKLAHFDILQQIKDVFGKRVSLDSVVKETLNNQKSDHGLNAVYYWKSKNKESLKKLKKYCEDDVLLTKDVYDFVLANGYVLFKDKWNTRRKVELDFSYPEKLPSESQIGLF